VEEEDDLTIREPDPPISVSLNDDTDGDNASTILSTPPTSTTVQTPQTVKEQPPLSAQSLISPLSDNDLSNLADVVPVEEETNDSDPDEIDSQEEEALFEELLRNEESQHYHDPHGEANELLDLVVANSRRKQRPFKDDDDDFYDGDIDNLEEVLNLLPTFTCFL
jgi:hypothetical protein